MSVNMAIFFGSMCFFIYRVAISINFNNQDAMIWFTAIILPVLMIGNYVELIYWLAGACSYTFPLSLFLFGAGIAINPYTNHFACIISCACLFLMGGGSLQIAIWGAYILFSFFAYESISKKLLVKKYRPYLFVIMVGIVINVFAPGNEVRRNSSSSLINDCYNALMGSVVTSISDISLLITEHLFFLVLLIGGALGLFYLKRIKYCIILCMWSAGLIVCSIFPILLGYGVSNHNGFYGRTKLLIVLSLVIFIESVGACGMAFLSTFLGNEKLYQIVCLVGIILILIINLQYYQNCQPIVLARGLLDGSIIEYSKSVDAVYDYILKNKEDNLIVTEFPDPVSGCYAVEFVDDTNYWVNEDMAEYLGINSICYRRR